MKIIKPLKINQCHCLFALTSFNGNKMGWGMEGGTLSKIMEKVSKITLNQLNTSISVIIIAHTSLYPFLLVCAAQ